MGDRVSDQRAHGGADKALCCYPHEHYAYWSKRLGAELSVPSFGENLTTAGLLEEQVCIGDQFGIGSAVVQVSQPRQPCWKLASRHAQPRMIGWVNEQAFTGFYFRVLTAGSIAADHEIVLLERPCPELKVALATRLRLAATPDRQLLARLAALPVLSEAWRKQFSRMLAGDAEVASELPDE